MTQIPFHLPNYHLTGASTAAAPALAAPDHAPGALSTALGTMLGSGWRRLRRAWRYSAALRELHALDDRLKSGKSQATLTDSVSITRIRQKSIIEPKHAKLLFDDRDLVSFLSQRFSVHCIATICFLYIVVEFLRVRDDGCTSRIEFRCTVV